MSGISACETDFEGWGTEDFWLIVTINHQGVEMRQKSVHAESSSERIVKDIRRATRKRYSY
jgi:hypothetical protein